LIIFEIAAHRGLRRPFGFAQGRLAALGMTFSYCILRRRADDG
jgi:hypothetical protein